jgi:hypothetical protein
MGVVYGRNTVAGFNAILIMGVRTTLIRITPVRIGQN